MKYSYKIAVLYLSALLFTDFKCGNKKKIKTSQGKSEEPKENAVPDTLKNINFDDSQEHEEKKTERMAKQMQKIQKMQEERKKAEEELKKTQEEYQKREEELKKTQEEYQKREEEDKEWQAQYAKRINEKNKTVIALDQKSQQLTKVLQKKNEELEEIYNPQKEEFQKLYEKKVQIIDDKKVIIYIHNVLADGKKKKTLNKLLKDPSVQDTIQEVAKYINDSNLSLKDWALTLPYKELTSFTNLLHNTTGPLSYVNSFLILCAEIDRQFKNNLPTYENSPAGKHLRKIVFELFDKKVFLLIDKIKDTINEIEKESGKLSANKKTLKEQLDKKKKQCIDLQNTWR